MLIEIDFNSDEALYLQLRNQIILGIATNTYHEGDALPSVRALADEIGINMHTVNKAYSVLREDGYVKVDRRRGAVIAVDREKKEHLNRFWEVLAPVVFEAVCKDVSKQELHKIIDDIYDKYNF
ncbi:MAG: GntR family transcriptional regulator [Lachnospiraceae bacterium]|nr:GntR family transcriptional regulator [Lachnospiraceae bacterium]